MQNPGFLDPANVLLQHFGTPRTFCFNFSASDRSASDCNVPLQHLEIDRSASNTVLLRADLWSAAGMSRRRVSGKKLKQNRLNAKSPRLLILRMSQENGCFRWFCLDRSASTFSRSHVSTPGRSPLARRDSESPLDRMSQNQASEAEPLTGSPRKLMDTFLAARIQELREPPGPNLQTTVLLQLTVLLQFLTFCFSTWTANS